MGYWSFFTQDLPQGIIHVCFKIFIFSDRQRELKTQTLLMVSLVVTFLANCISVFNMIMCDQNEFDPTKMAEEIELRKYRYKKIQIQKEQERKEKEEEEKKQAAQIRRQETRKDKGLLDVSSSDGEPGLFAKKLMGHKKKLEDQFKEDDKKVGP